MFSSRTHAGGRGFGRAARSAALLGVPLAVGAVGQSQIMSQTAAPQLEHDAASKVIYRNGPRP